MDSDMLKRYLEPCELCKEKNSELEGSYIQQRILKTRISELEKELEEIKNEEL